MGLYRTNLDPKKKQISNQFLIAGFAPAAAATASGTPLLL